MVLLYPSCCWFPRARSLEDVEVSICDVKNKKCIEGIADLVHVHLEKVCIRLLGVRTREELYRYLDRKLDTHAPEMMAFVGMHGGRICGALILHKNAMGLTLGSSHDVKKFAWVWCLVLKEDMTDIGLGGRLCEYASATWKKKYKLDANQRVQIYAWSVNDFLIEWYIRKMKFEMLGVIERWNYLRNVKIVRLTL